MPFKFFFAILLALVAPRFGAAQAVDPRGQSGVNPGSLLADDTEPGTPQGGDAWPEDPNRTRLLFGANGRSLHQGEIYLDVIGINVTTIQVGLTDRFSVGAGAPLLIPGIHPLEVYWLTPKLQVYSSARTSAAIGAIHIGVRDAGVGVAYTSLTHGSDRGAVTAGIGYAYARGEGGVPVLQLGGERRVSRRTVLLTENYVGAGLSMLSGGLRFINKRNTFDVGVFVHPQSGIAFPMVRWTLGFDTRRSGGDRRRDSDSMQ